MSRRIRRRSRLPKDNRPPTPPEPTPASTPDSPREGSGEAPDQDQAGITEIIIPAIPTTEAEDPAPMPDPHEAGAEHEAGGPWDDKLTRTDLQMMGRAIKGRWPLTDENRAKMVERLMKIVEDPDTSRRQLTSTIRLLKEIDCVNVEAEKAPDGKQIIIINQQVQADAATELQLWRQQMMQNVPSFDDRPSSLPSARQTPPT